MKKIVPLIIGVSILLMIFYYFDTENIIALLSKTNLFYFILAAFCYLVIEILAALKLKLVSKLNFSQIFFSHQGGMIFTYAIPGRVGYLYTAYSLAKKIKKSISSMVGLITLVQGIMIGAKIFSISVALIYFSFILKIPNSIFLSLLLPIMILAGIIFLLYSKTPQKLLSKIPVINKAVKYLNLMQKSVKKVDKKKAIKMIMIDFIGWFFYGLQFFLLLNALGIHLPPIIYFMLHPLISAVMFIPISPTALGIAESESAFLFYLLGLSFETGVAFLLLFRINTLIIDAIGLIDLKTIKIPKKINIFSK